MKHGLSGVRLQLVLAAALASLLLVLATLQYKWIGEVSDADRERMRASAHRAAEGVAGDFGREVSRALDLFGMPPGSSGGGEDPGAHAAAASRRWNSESAFPKLIAEAFLAEEEAGTLRLQRVDLASGARGPADWPPALERLHGEMAGDPRPDPGGRPPHEGGPGPRGFGAPHRPFGPQVIAAVPAIVIPDMRRPEAPGDFRGRAARWLILRLDESAMRSRWLPELVRRHFGSAGDYDVAVLRRDAPEEILYTTRTGFP